MTIPVDATDDVCRQRPTRVLTQILSFRTDLGILRADRAGDSRVDRTRQVDEGLVALQLLQHGRGIWLVVQLAGDLLGDIAQALLRVGCSRRLLPGLFQLPPNPLRLERQGTRLDGEREPVIVAVDDAAASRWLDVGDLELAGRLRTQARGM
ncbi:Uncharacterised protein [Mycobacterium tuberculosis]|uniref:Uncharacterized protein n=1 Tax=Mycobacterium tuberculosis TaxID=1773 RepID=A0A655EE63_MYCTX|nr:Uncharacterised protein [Mycobacterium tuberculosis]CFS18699.1 Uncharacterised protein [Mycobacterium tuberculosis]CNV17153.1 Uncharacterised protein [Mycobacterium tuberculosis]CNV41826.1 Uncharacterised protein [Mycobacterium tuberculosis]CNV46852.1 Uncharacterised protein [Mycobacterium tuberculosis]